jgi:enediyne biosynthesis protein E5
MSPEEARLGALKRFAVAITVLNVLGHTVLGFEVSVVQLLACALTGYVVEALLEVIGAWSEKRPPRFIGGGLSGFVIFLLPAHITALATSMMLFSGDAIMPLIFGVTIGIASKSVFTVMVAGKRRHFLNPSNTGIIATILVFPSVLSIPYHFTEELYGYWDWALPALILCTGTFLNARFTKRIPLILAWLLSFALQAVIRHYVFGTWLPASLATMTGVVFLLFTFYMITDPQTSPSSVRGQIIFGAAVGTVYGVLMAFHIVLTIFGALFLVCLGRGILLYVCELAPIRKMQERLWSTFPGRATPAIVPAAPAD